MRPRRRTEPGIRHGRAQRNASAHTSRYPIPSQSQSWLRDLRERMLPTSLPERLPSVECRASQPVPSRRERCGPISGRVRRRDREPAPRVASPTRPPWPADCPRVYPPDTLDPPVRHVHECPGASVGTHGNPPPITLPSVVRSGVTPVSACAPPRWTRNPVITSSKINTVSASVVIARGLPGTRARGE